MDEISTGLDSATTFVVVKWCAFEGVWTSEVEVAGPHPAHLHSDEVNLCPLGCVARADGVRVMPPDAYVLLLHRMRTIAHALRLNVVISLLQPAPEVHSACHETAAEDWHRRCELTPSPNLAGV